MLYSKEFDPQNQGQEFNHRNTRDYLHVVEDMFKKGKRTKLKYQSDSDEENKPKKKINTYALQLELNGKVNRNLGVKNTENYVSDDSQEESPETIKHKNKVSKALANLYNEELDSLNQNARKFSPISKDKQ